MSLRAQFNIWLYGLLVIVSLVQADENDYDLCRTFLEEHTPVIWTMDNETRINSSVSEIQCFIYNLRHLSCSWRTDLLPENAQYSAYFQFSDMPKQYPFTTCVSESSKKLVECQGQVEMSLFDKEHMAVVVNISINGYSHPVYHCYNLGEIEKLNPPQNLTAVYTSTNLEIQWSQTRSCCSKQNKCFSYELNINNEFVNVEKVLAYNLTNFEPTRSYTIQIRTKHKTTCVSNNVWSDWSKAVVINPLGNTYHLKAGVIASIVLVFPMILLALLLVCKCQRLFDKLYPSVPNPSKNVQKLLEKNFFNQDAPPKSEEGVDVLEVIG